MTDVYVIRNQYGHFWGKRKAWVSGAEAKLVLRTKHEDEAINTLFELSTKDIELRGEVVPATLSERGEPMVKASEIPLPEEVPPPEAVPPGETERAQAATTATATSGEATGATPTEATTVDTEKVT